MVPYKQIQMVVEAFARMPERQLVVIGDGPCRQQVEALAADNVSILGFQPEAVLIQHLQQARALVFMGEEDFGLLPVEAQLCGTPVIAYGCGGVTETVRDGQTGVLVPEQTIDALIEAIDQFESMKLCSPAAIRHHALKFDQSEFLNQFPAFVENATVSAGGDSTSSAPGNIKKPSENGSGNNF